MSHVFISYNREDQHRARGIADGLEAEGLKVWWDTNLRAGESYDEVTEKNLREAGAVVVLWSKRSVNSKWVRAEATVGERFSKLVPAMIEECERPLRFELVQTADLISWHGDRASHSWREFIHDIKLALGHDDQTPAAQDQAVHAASAAAVNAGGGASPDVTIENTFWNSIKDGNDKAEFEAYLNRYPDGHFTDLARSRLAAIERAAAAKTRTAAPPPVQPAPQKSAPPHERPSHVQSRPAQPAVRPTPRREPLSQPAPARAEKSGTGMWIAVALGALVVGLGAVVAIQMLGGQSQDGSASVQVASNGQAGVDETHDAALSDPANTIPSAGRSEENSADGAVAADITSPATGSDDRVSGEGAASVGDVVDPVQDDVTDQTELTVAADPLEATTDTAVTDTAPADQAGGVSGDKADEVFSDCPQCPEMKILPTGTFMMGSPSSEPGHLAYEGPQHEVSIKSFAIGVYEVTHDQWAACVAGGGCGGYRPGDGGFGAGARPVLSVSWDDASAYVRWLSSKTGRSYRLPTEAEWEYAARGGADTAYWWGAGFDSSQAATGRTVEAGSLNANGFGLHEVTGNVSEWVQDCYVNNFANTPADGSAMTGGDCSRRVIRGGSWRGDRADLRVANRSRVTRSIRDRRFGFRIAVDVE